MRAGTISDFTEKPKAEQVAGDEWRTGDGENPYVGSMGIYLFKREALERLLADEPEAAPVAKGAPPAPGTDVHFGYVRDPTRDPQSGLQQVIL